MCTGVNAPRFGGGFGAGYGMGGGMRARNGSGFGFRGGRGYGGGRAWGNTPAFGGGYPMAQSSLEERAATLEAELKTLRQRMAEMEKESAE
ncbi:hypothetical protein DWB63_12670 [Pseudodesulfovibrio sp. S3]|nr:hypothetical protein DWB63_12670 [Pseudodesulfovibrio sp. S3]